MAVTSELAFRHRVIAELSDVIGSVHSRFGDIAAVTRLPGYVDRILPGAADPDEMAPPSPAPEQETHLIDDTPPDPSSWADADDEGPDGYHGGRR